MAEKHPAPYPEKGARRAPERAELTRFVRAADHAGGRPDMPAEARTFAHRFAATLTRYPDFPQELPNWLRAMIEKKVSVEELAQGIRDRLHRAPSESNQQLALLLANEVARMKGGSEMLQRHVTPDLLQRLGGSEGAAS